MIAIVPVFAMILGGAVYVIASKAEVKEMGRLVFGSGALVFIYSMAEHYVALFH